LQFLWPLTIREDSAGQAVRSLQQIKSTEHGVNLPTKSAFRLTRPWPPILL
jgi:hypothetical protein